jgi:hypothetical protein
MLSVNVIAYGWSVVPIFRMKRFLLCERLITDQQSL